MKSSRFITYLFGFYILITGIAMVILSTTSIFAYHCHFHENFEQSQIGYFFHLVYYRSMNCDTRVDWTLLGIENITTQNTPQIPDELDTVKITYWFSISHLIANGLVTLTCLSMLLATRFYWLILSRRWSYWIFFAPVSIIIFISVLIDLTSGWFYSHDRLRAFSIDGTMTLLQVRNRVEARPIVQQIDVEVRTFPPTALLYISLKGIVGVIIDVFAVFFITLSGWEVVDGNKKRITIEPIISKDNKTTL